MKFMNFFSFYTSQGQNPANYSGNLLQSQDQQMKDLGHENVLLSKQYRTATENALIVCVMNSNSEFYQHKYIIFMLTFPMAWDGFTCMRK